MSRFSVLRSRPCSSAVAAVATVVGFSALSPLTTPGATAAAPSHPATYVAAAVLAIAPHDVWLLGASHQPRSPSLTLAEHWDGRRWTVTPTPSPGRQANDFLSGSASGPDDVWAVGLYSRTGGTQTHTLAEHWDGASWTETPVPQAAGTHPQLTAVSADAPDDAWAVGFEVHGDPTAVVDHWDGTAWSSVDDIPGLAGTALSSVDAVAPDDVWVAGGRFVAHFDGTSWTQFSVPGVDPSGINGIRAFSSTDVLAVGDCWDVVFQACGWQWDGTAWTSSTVAPFKAASSTLFGVSGGSPTDAWAVGQHNHRGEDTSNLVEHWDGTAWTLVRSPNPVIPDWLTSVSTVSPTDAWAVGVQGDGSQLVPLHWNGTTWRKVPGATPGG